jgi:hypothetical protein
MITISWPLAITYAMVLLWIGCGCGICIVALFRAADQENDERVFQNRYKKEIEKWMMEDQ